MADPADQPNTKSNDSFKLPLKRKFDETLNHPDSIGKSTVGDLEHHHNLNVEYISKVIAPNDMVQDELSVSDRTLERTLKVFPSTTNTENAARSSEIMDEITNVNKNGDETPDIFERTYSELESINEDCFRQIVRYLNIIDVANLAATCTQMLYFAESLVFPKKATNIYIKIFSETIVYMTAPLSNAHTFAIPLKRVETSIGYFGKFIEKLTFVCYKCEAEEQSKIERSLAIIIEHCKNLSSLHYYCDFQPFTHTQTNAFKVRIEMLQNLKELELCGCPGITGNWPASLESSSKLEALTLIGKNTFSDNFFDYFMNLTSLKVVFRNSDWKADDIAKIFNKTGHCLKQLTLRHLDYVQGYETVGKLITEKLPKLESLELSFELTNASEYMIALPQLKSLTILCAEEKRINALLRSLSDNNIVNKLRINGGVFDVEDENAEPFTFNKLQSFDWSQKGGMLHFLNAMTRAEIPAIQSIGFNRIKPEEINGVLELLEAKKSLKNVDLTFDMTLIPFSFWRQLISILKEPSTPKRPLLNFVISGNDLTKEEIDFLNSNRDCIKLDYSF